MLLSAQTEELWLEIPGFPNYRASTHGQIASRPRLGSKGGILKQHTHARTGYVYLMLYRDGVPCTRSVHTLIAITFLGPRPEGREVNHIDGDKQNNRSANLEYITRSENEKHAYRLGLKHNRPPIHLGDQHHNAKLTLATAREIRLLYRAGGCTQRELARHFRVSQQCIWNVLNKNTWVESKSLAIEAA